MVFTVHVEEEVQVKILCIAMTIFFSFLPCCCADPLGAMNSRGTRDELTLQCRVDHIDFQERDASFARLNLGLTVRLVNTGTAPIILLRKEPAFPGAKLARSSDDLAKGNYLHSTYSGPAVDLSDQWASLREKLDQPTPPSDLTRTLMPGETWELKVERDLIFDSSPSTYPKQKSFKEIQKASPVSLQVVCDVWPFNVEPLANDPTASEKLPLGHKLQRRWQSYGTVWLETLLSEPVLLDLRNVVTAK